MSDGRLLTLGALGALVAAAAVRGSRGIVRKGALPPFVLTKADETLLLIGMDAAPSGDIREALKPIYWRINNGTRIEREYLEALDTALDEFWERMRTEGPADNQERSFAGGASPGGGAATRRENTLGGELTRGVKRMLASGSRGLVRKGGREEEFTVEELQDWLVLMQEDMPEGPVKDTVVRMNAHRTFERGSLVFLQKTLVAFLARMKRQGPATSHERIAVPSVEHLLTKVEQALSSGSRGVVRKGDRTPVVSAYQALVFGEDRSVPILIERCLAQAKEDNDDLQIDIRLTPTSTGISELAHRIIVEHTADPATLAAEILRRLDAHPGVPYVGEIRINFSRHFEDETVQRYASFTRVVNATAGSRGVVRKGQGTVPPVAPINYRHNQAIRVDGGDLPREDDLAFRDWMRTVFYGGARKHGYKAGQSAKYVKAVLGPQDTTIIFRHRNWVWCRPEEGWMLYVDKRGPALHTWNTFSIAKIPAVIKAFENTFEAGLKRLDGTP